MTEPIIAIIPIRGADDEFRDGSMPLLVGRPLIEYTIMAAKDAKQVDRIIVSTDSEPIAQACRAYGVEAPFLRPAALSASGSNVTQVLRHAVEWLEEHENYRTEWVVKLEITHPFRPTGLIDLLIETALTNGVDSAFLAHEELGSFWTINAEGIPELVDEEVDVPKRQRRSFYLDVSGLGSITRAANLKAGRLYGPQLGLIPCHDLFALVDTHAGQASSYRERAGFRLAELLAPAFNEQLAHES